MRGTIGQNSVNDLQPRVSADKKDKDGQPLNLDNFLWDDKLPGFGVKVTPTGAKTFLFQYRLGGRGHKTQRVTIGAAGIKAAAAREIAEALYVRVRQGEDVAATAKERKRVAVELAFSKYVEDFADRVLKPKWPKSYKLTKARLVTHAAKHLGDKPLTAVTAEDVRGLLRRLDDQPAAKRNLFTALSYLFNQSIKDGVLKESPLRAVETPSAVAARDRTLDDDELRWFWAALQDEAEPYRGVIEDLLLMGQRRNETAGLPWSELNRDRKEWHLPANRAKNGCENFIPLTDRAVVRLDAIAGKDKWPRSGLVRKSSKGTPLSGWSKVKARIDGRMVKAAKAAKAEFKPWRLHDLRRTIATNMQRLRIDHEVVEHLLNHREKARTGIAAVYQTHGFMPEKRKALEHWESELERILRGDESRVIPFARNA